MRKAKLPLRDKPEINKQIQMYGHARSAGYNAGMRSAIDVYSMVALMVLWDKFDFKAEELADFTEKSLDMFDSVKEGYLSLDDIVKTLDEEAGLDRVAERVRKYNERI